MNEFLMTTYTVVLPIGLGYIVWLLKEQTKIRSANSEGTKCLLRFKLIEYHDKYMEKKEMYEAYKRLGGNGMIEGMDREIHELRII